MPRPTIIHCVQRWVSEDAGLVDVIESCTATRPLVVCRERASDPRGAGVRSVNLDASRPGLPSASDRRRLVLLAAAILRWRGRLVHVHDAAWGPTAAALSKRLGVRLVVTLPEDAGSTDPVPAWVRDAALVIVTSPAALAATRDMGLDARTVRLLDTAVDLDDEPRVEHRSSGAPLRALGLGGWPGLQQACDEHSPGGVRIAEADEADPLLDDADVVLAHRSALESSVPLRRMLVRAQARGLPVVLAGGGGSDDAVDERAAAIVGDDPRKIASLLFELARDGARRAAMGRHGRRHAVLHHELGSRTAQLEDHYMAVIEGRPLADGRIVRRREWPTVSVVIPAYNRRELLGAALDALEQQTYPAEMMDVVVVDNGSTDGTTDELRTRTPPWKLTVLRNEDNTSAAAARNRALEQAHGEVLAFTDSDCRPVPTWLESLVAGLQAGVTIVQGRTVPDAAEVGALARSQSVPYEYGLYETCNIAYGRDALGLAGTPPFRTDLPARMEQLLGPGLGRQAFGEDAELAWRAKRGGARSRFATHAVVRHHVFESDVSYLLQRAALTAGFPALVAEVPELRRAFLWHGTFLSRDRPFFWAAACGLALGVSKPSRLVLAVPYVLRRVQPRYPGATARLRALPQVAAVDVVTSAALLYGSARARRVVL